MRPYNPTFIHIKSYSTENSKKSKTGKLHNHACLIQDLSQMWEACLPLRSMFWSVWAFPGMNETCNPGAVRRQVCQRGQFADFHSFPLEEARRKPSLKADSLCMVRIITWETANTFFFFLGVFYIQSGGYIINHPNWDTCESKRGVLLIMTRGQQA